MSIMRIKGIDRGEPITIQVDGKEITAFAGESIAAAMMASGLRTTQMTKQGGSPRGYFCGMGACFDCIATVDGVDNVRTCNTSVHPGCEVETG
ncbi:MAG: (2Fe-2S)-binding protein [Arenicellales bacterium]|nr:(2Fe-2S)-binding protein [Arenicellales bacterium]